MKTFEPGFFDLKNFIIKQETFDALPEGSDKPWHVAYNVNDPFSRSWGPPWSLCWKITRASPWCSICSPTATAGRMWKSAAAGGEVALPVRAV